jgi:DNA-binding XRE family transcriptional regulator
MATPDREGLMRLAKLVAQQRIKLGWHKVQAATAAGLTHTTYMRVEKGQPVRDVTYAGIEAAFEWAPGACLAILAGATEAQEAGEVRGGVRFAPDAAVEAKVRAAIQNATIAVLPETPTVKMAEFTDVIVAELQRRGIVPTPDEESTSA